MVDCPILVLHDVGAPEGGAPWRTALEAEEWAGAVHAPDLPGHGGAPPPIGGNYELGDAVFAVLPLLAELDARPVVVGVGANGWPAQLLALGGRAAALVLVDGIGGPWLDPAASINAGRNLLRAIADDPDAVGHAVPGGVDPRLRHGVMRQTSRALAERTFNTLAVPTLLIESPEAPLAADARAELVRRCPSATLLEVSDVRPASVVPKLVEGLRSLPSACRAPTS